MNKVKILAMSDSPKLHTGFACVARNVLTHLQRTGKYEIKQIGWFHQESNEEVIYPIIQTEKDESGKITQEDKYAHKTFTKVVEDYKPDIVWTLGDHWMTDHVAKCKLRNTFKWIMYCFKGDTDVVTRDGIKNIKDLSVNDYAMSVSMDGKVSFQKIIVTHERDYSGSMINIKGDYVDFSVTPEHRMILKKQGNKKFGWITAEKLKSDSLKSTTQFQFPEFSPVDGKHEEEFFPHLYLDENFDIVIDESDINLFDRFNLSDRKRHHQRPYKFTLKIRDIKDNDLFIDTCKKCKTMPYIKGKIKDRSSLPVIMKMDDFLSLCGWFLSEGSIEDGKCNRIQIAQQEINNVEISHRHEIKDLLERMKIPYKEKFTGFTIAGAPIVELMKTFGRRSENRNIPNWVFELDHSHLIHLFNSMMAGDGSRTGFNYWSVSDLLRRSFSRLCFHLGFGATIYENKSGVGVRKFKKHSWINKGHIAEEQFNGKVYCVTVENNGTILAGRNNKFQFIGQCPIDGHPSPSKWKDAWESADYLVAYGKYGMEVMRHRAPKANLSFVYHGVDTDTFRPISEVEKSEVRKTVIGVAGDKKLIGIIARNQPRKAFDKLFEAYYYVLSGDYVRCNKCHKVTVGSYDLLTKKATKPTTCKHCSSTDVKNGASRDDVRLYAHGAIQDCGWDLIDLQNDYNLKGKVLVNPSLRIGAGVADSTLNGIYNAIDIFTLPTRGEGFGLPILESMAAGTPVIVTDYSAHPEWCKDAGLLVPPAALEAEPLTNIRRAIIDTDLYVTAIIDLLDCKDLRTKLGENGIEIARKMDWKVICKQWEDMIDPIAYPQGITVADLNSAKLKYNLEEF